MLAPWHHAMLAALLSTGAAAHAQSHYPVRLDNCGVTVNIDAPPASIVTIGQSVTETLYALGLGDRLAGTSLWFNDVLPEFKAQNDRVPRLADNAPSFESVVNKRPGLVATQYEWMIGPKGAVGTREQFAQLGIPTYVLPADCDGKNNLVGADGTRIAAYSIETLYKSITQLASMFDKDAAGAALVAELRGREATAVKRIAELKLPDVSAAFWFSSADMELDPYTAGQKGVPGFMMATLGIRNVVRSDEEWPTVGWETIAKANPSILVIARMDRRRFPADDYQRKLAFLHADPVTREMEAVKRGRIVVLDAQAMEASPRLIGGMETLAEAVSKLDQ